MHKSLSVALALVLPTMTLAQQPIGERSAITGISHVTLFADNIPKSKQFYGSLLGWDPVPATGAESGVRFYANHLQYIELVSPPQPSLDDRLDLIAFSTSNAGSLRRFLVANGVTVPKEVTTERDGSRSFQVRDRSESRPCARGERLFRRHARPPILEKVHLPALFHLVNQHDVSRPRRIATASAVCVGL
jgi:catechol 2,3-dioxygenase-like lactoylglutathione lyase family enzyme